MSRIERSNTTQDAERARSGRPRKLDARTKRTRQRLGDAYLGLLHEKAIEDVTVQDVLDRALVGRSTFYLHYRDINDLLLSQLEFFLETMSTMLIVRKEQSQRVVPVTEMFAHIASAKKMYRLLGDAGRLNDFYDLAQGYFERGIEVRLRESNRLPKLSQRELAARSSALAGSLLSLLRWWLVRGSIEPAEKMDELFHQMVWNGLEGSKSSS